MSIRSLDIIDEENDYFHTSQRAYFMNESIFYQCRQRLATLVTRRAVGYRYSLPTDNVSICCNCKFVDYFIEKTMGCGEGFE